MRSAFTFFMQSSKKLKEKVYIVCIFIILLLGSILRIYKLGFNSLWFDEASFLLYGPSFFSISDLMKGLWSQLLSGHLRTCNHAYTYFAVFWGIFAKNEFIVRLPSAIFGIISIFLIYKLGELFFSKKTGIMSAFILSISPFHIYYSQEFRAYSLITMLTIASVYLFKKFLESKKYKFLIGYMIVTILNIYCQIVTVLILIAEILFFIFYFKKYSSLFKKWLLGHFLIAIFLIPEIFLIAVWLRALPKEAVLAMLVSTTSELGRISLLAPFFTLKNFSIGYNASPAIYFPAMVLFLILFIRGLLLTKNREELNFCLFYLFVPILILYILQKFKYADRYLIPSSVFFYLIISNSLISAKKNFTIIALTMLSIFSSLSLYNYYRNYLPGSLESRIAEHSKKEYREAANYIIDNFKNDDFIVYVDFNSMLSFEYYFQLKRKCSNIINMSQEEKKFRLNYGLPLYWPVATLSENKEKVDLIDFHSKYGRGVFKKFSLAGKERIWLIFSAREFEEANKPGSEEHRIVEWFDQNYTKNNTKAFRGIILYLYTKK